ncbi:BREX-1 system adenine-specific DNA-methyltransferase PglX [Magnetospirillum moscoviense]|uniref:site-specific DNA-methyltransferase (adenine-specific) n=1 Tax=Magnetospirillum moscoviense TaxID=1437059 RepID=A0A178M6Y1_9PROT|nr:BREX-1 system adenine-specific DNA-methyltransferase PglX [Magnetospirillum moscoviense]OAN44502.1 hypothetical protein A6A05_04890 [Magnetospirillum moscoviense]
MNRNKLKTYAPKARRDFIAAVTARAIKFGISKDAIEPLQVQGNVALIAGQAHPRKVADQRSKLESRVKTRGFEQVMEEAAYTWFNRFAAIRYMEVHGYLDHGYRVLSHPDGKATPEIVEHAQHLDLPGLDKEKVIELKLDGTKEGDLYRMLLMAQCNALNSAMPFLFERIDDETELLLPDNLLHSDSVIRQMVNEIEEADWQEIEIIGWLYQFYISEKKDQVIGKVVKSEDIPAATQLFTPNWIVKYMVQNTLGAKWLATYPQSGIRAKMEFYIEPAEQTDEVNAKLAAITPKELNPEEITFLDPACGSGHILVEAYDLFKDIYLERGYVLRDVPRLILEKNLFGLDIDDRAAQMAAFALLMKARGDDRRVFDRSICMNVMAIQDSKGLDAKEICRVLVPDERFELVPRDDLLPDTLPEPTLAKGSNRKLGNAIQSLIKLYEDGKIFGSLTFVPALIKLAITDIVRPLKLQQADGTLNVTLYNNAINSIMPLIMQSYVLSGDYDCVAANPPYMGNRGLLPQMKEYGKIAYKHSRHDMSAMFIDRCAEFINKGGIASLVTMHGWMFLGLFEEFRLHMVNGLCLRNMAHLGARAFPEIGGEVVQTTVFSFSKKIVSGLSASFIRAVDSDGNKKVEAVKTGNRHVVCPDRFAAIEGYTFAYWLSDALLKLFESGSSLKDICDARVGLQTGNNDKFVRQWWEVDFDGILCGGRAGGWVPYNKGGGYRKWYGSIDLVVNWSENGKGIRNYTDKNGDKASYVRNEDMYFKEGITWSDISTSNLSFRIMPSGCIWDSSGHSAFSKTVDDSYAALAYCNTNIVNVLGSIINPTIHFHIGYFQRLPAPKTYPSESSDLAKRAVAISKRDWDSRETSIDFGGHNYISCDVSAAEAFICAINNSGEQVRELVEIEGCINKLFNRVLHISGEVSDSVGIESISLRVLDQHLLSKYFVSYAVGCMMGRYSLDEPGLIYANSGNVGFDPSRYTTFPADDDGIVPIMQTDWFNDDATNRVVEFIKVAWSPETLTENLKFVADSLGAKSGESPIDTIRRYLSSDFFKDHLKTYKKRPIYWLFSSGKEKAFEALVYLHRYNEGTLSRMRMEYVTPLQGRIASKIDQLGRDIDAVASTAAQNKLRKEQEKLKKQQAELVKFDEELRHYADMRIKLDLDDGVKVNYGKFGNLLAETKAITGGSDE